MVGERGLDTIHRLIEAIIPERPDLGEKSTIIYQQLSGQKTSSVKSQEILSWKCPSAFFGWEISWRKLNSLLTAGGGN
jgi:hypothetical protein